MGVLKVFIVWDLQELGLTHKYGRYSDLLQPVCDYVHWQSPTNVGISELTYRAKPLIYCIELGTLGFSVCEEGVPKGLELIHAIPYCS